jgi:hypothetical protein
MKPILYSILFLLTATHSVAQVPDTLNQVQDSVYFYIDGIKVRSYRGNCLSIGSSEDVQIITGGIPVNYGDCVGSIITVIRAPRMKTPVQVSDKEQNMATE